MADGKNSGGPGNKRATREPAGQTHDLDARRFALGQKLMRVRVSRKPEREAENQGAPSGAAQALRLSSEFLAAIVVGVVLGLGLDQLTGASPWGLVVFLLLGFAAGVLNVLRSAGRAAASTVGKKGKGLDKPD